MNETLALYLGVGLAGVVLLEHAGRKLNVRFIRLSWYLNLFYNILLPVVQVCGCIVAEIGTFLGIMDLGGLGVTARDLIVSTARLTNLPCAFCKSIWTRIHEVASMTEFVLGLAVLAASVYATAASVYATAAGMGALSMAGVLCLAHLLKLHWPIKTNQQRNKTAKETEETEEEETEEAEDENNDRNSRLFRPIRRSHGSSMLPIDKNLAL